MTKITKTFQYGRHAVTFETGEIARQATGSVLVRMGDTVILVTVVAKKETEEGRDFFPLTVNYIEKTYAAGKIPGGFLKRESKPSDRETLIARLIDRPVRPLFPEAFTNEVQVIITVLSMDPTIPADIPAMLGASAALMLSGIPFQGPIAGARVGHCDGIYQLNPSFEELKTSRLDLVVAGTKQAVLMVESKADELPESIMLGAVLYGHEQMQTAIRAIEEFVKEAGSPSWNWQAPATDTALKEHVTQLVKNDLIQAYKIREKQTRQTTLQTLRDRVTTQLCTEKEGAPSSQTVSDMIHHLEQEIVRGEILAGQPRIDGRDTKTIRPINVQTGLLPRTHGSAVFTRGETQAIVTVTLGSERDSQIIDDLLGNRREPFMLHYNFPPFSVGETGMLGAPKRREVGHGNLARRGLEAILPTAEQFPYVLRIVSEITESNGSSSMATVCGSSLALMDAGVPVKAPVAGIAMGLIKEGDRFAILSDILGDEDHLGDMDFKVAGSENGVTALQMDIKINGITGEIMEKALEQAREGRLHILGIMNKAISKPRETMSQYAPQIITIKIHPDKIRDVIGKGGATIREITESTSSTIDIGEDGTIRIAVTSIENGEAAKRRIQEIIADVEIGKIYDATITRIMDFGALASFLGKNQGLIHISQISEEHVENIGDYLQEGQKVRVKVLDMDRQGRIRLSLREALREMTE